MYKTTIGQLFVCSSYSKGVTRIVSFSSIPYPVHCILSMWLLIVVFFITLQFSFGRAETMLKHSQYFLSCFFFACIPVQAIIKGERERERESKKKKNMEFEKAIKVNEKNEQRKRARDLK